MAVLTLGSLFDGIGVFPLAGSRYGIIPTWSSEVEKAPVSITKRQFPNMFHLGHITKNRWWKNTTCSYYYFWFSLSELIQYRKS